MSFDNGDDDYMEEEASNPDSILLALVQSYDWAGTLARISSFPLECKVVGVQGRTPLHVACDHDAPAVVVHALVRAFPEAAMMVGTSNMNPLHITCSSQHASVQVVRVLLESSGLASETASMCDVDGDTPLHAACRCGAPIDVLRVLLHAYPQAVHERDYEGLTPLLRLWVRYFVMLGDDVIDGVTGASDLVGDLGEAWKKTELLLACAYSRRDGQSQNSQDWSQWTQRAIFAAAAIDCPRPVVKIAAIVNHDLLVRRDETGQTPLLVAATTPIYKVRDLSDDGYMLEDRIHGDDTDSEVPNEEDTEQSQASVLDLIVQACPAAAGIPDMNGTLPLHVSLTSGKRWNEGVRALLDANPDALSQCDKNTRLLPFMLAAATQRPDVGTIYELLRRDPSMLLPKVPT